MMIWYLWFMVSIMYLKSCQRGSVRGFVRVFVRDTWGRCAGPPAVLLVALFRRVVAQAIAFCGVRASRSPPRHFSTQAMIMEFDSFSAILEPLAPHHSITKTRKRMQLSFSLSLYIYIFFLIYFFNVSGFICLAGRLYHQILQESGVKQGDPSSMVIRIVSFFHSFIPPYHAMD